mmetsp:Transcript_56485/g.138643  ORF Transcript_56485/g.138643 Transcript_56485/m.138643 type:complete len:297 (-) Transcript_56485:1043-1933(-)
MRWPSSCARRSTCSASCRDAMLSRVLAFSSWRRPSLSMRSSWSLRFICSIASIFSCSMSRTFESSASMARSRSRVLSFSVSNCCTFCCALDFSCLPWLSSSSVLASCSASTPSRSLSASASDSSALSAAAALLLSCSRRMTVVSSLRLLSSALSLKVRIELLSWLISARSCSSRDLYFWLSSLRPSCSCRSSCSHLMRSCSSLILSSSMYRWRSMPCSSIWRISTSICWFFCSVSWRACSMVARASSASLSMCRSLSLSWVMVLRVCSDLCVRTSTASLRRFSLSVAFCSSLSSLS